MIVKRDGVAAALFKIRGVAPPSPMAGVLSHLLRIGVSTRRPPGPEIRIGVSHFDYFAGVGGQAKILAGSAGTDTYTFENGTDTSILYSTAGLVDQNFLTNEDGSWSQVSFQFTAIDTTTRFGIYSNPVEPISIDVDDVSVTAVPEPTTLALLGLGGLLLRKRR